MTPDCLVIFSGGQDSTTCLYWAKQQFRNVHTITFDYGQRHAVKEVEAATAINIMAGVASCELVNLRDLLRGASPLVNHDNPVPHYDSAEAMPAGIDPTFVPMRNMLFLTVAANRAAVLGISNLVLGVCGADQSGYPDCRGTFILSVQHAINYGLGTSLFTIHTPLIHMSKVDIVKLGMQTFGCRAALAYSHTCYDGQYPPNPNNHASLLRAGAFHDAGFEDPLIVRAINDGLLPQDYPRDGYVVGTKFNKP